MMNLNLKNFSSHAVRVFFENGLESFSFQAFLISQIGDKPEVIKRFQKQF
jgi:hypothetical protein